MLLTIREGTFIINDNGFKIITQDSHLVDEYLGKDGVDSEDAKYKYKINY